MITIYGRGCARGLTRKLREMGVEVQRLDHGGPPPGALLWGRAANKYKELVTLAAAGLPVPEHTLERPEGALGITGNGWLARTRRHQKAADLTAELQRGDYYVRYVRTIREHRVHVFNGECIRVQMKVPMPEHPEPHPYFRSRPNGWRLVSGPEYTAQVPKGARDMAKLAVRAMGYLFGAVDIGVLPNGRPIVWEVNTQPGIRGSTVDVYAQAVIRWHQRQNG